MSYSHFEYRVGSIAPSVRPGYQPASASVTASGRVPRTTEGADKARAVQEAMAAVRDEYPHPFYWAPFTLVGSNR